MERSLFQVLEDSGPNTNNFQTSQMSPFKDFELFHGVDFQEDFQFNHKQFVPSKLFLKAFATAFKYSTTSPQQSKMTGGTPEVRSDKDILKIS